MNKHPVLNPGDTHKAVIRAKKLVVAHLKALGKEDLSKGISLKHATYGPNAVKGVRYIQRRYKIKVDGIIGPKTWKVLEYAAVKPPVPVLVVIPRASWGARTPRGVDLTLWSSKTVTRVHHTVTAKPAGSGKSLLEAEKEAAREIQKYHMDSRKYIDIAYNFLIMPSGRVFEGRGRQVVGAHTLGHNEDCGIAFVGNYNTDKLTMQQIVAFKLLRKKLGLGGGSAVPHCKTFNTSCPGSNVIEQLKLEK